MLCMAEYTVNSFQYNAAFINSSLAFYELLWAHSCLEFVWRHTRAPLLHMNSYIISLSVPTDPQSENNLILVVRK